MQILKSFSSLCLIFVLAFSGIGAGLSAQSVDRSIGNSARVTVPGSTVSLNMPELFVFDEAQSSYIYAGASSSISVKVLNGTSFTALSSSITKAGLEAQHMSVTATEEFNTTAGSRGMLYTAKLSITSSEENKNVEYKRYIFIAGNENQSVWITANFPVITEKLLDEPLKQAFRSVEF
jgi:hypothetical protein